MSDKTNAKTSMAKYNKAVTRARSAANRAGQAAWIIGDAALTVATVYGQNTLAKFADDITVELATVRNFRTLAAAYPAAKINRELQTATVYSVFVSQDDAFDLITNGNDGQPWTVSAARALVKSRNETDAPANDGEGDGGEGDGGEGDETDELALAMTEVDRLRAELDKAMAKVRKIRVSRGLPAEPAVVHSLRGIPSHTTDEPNTACTQCQLAGLVPQASQASDLVPAGRNSRRRAA